MCGIAGYANFTSMNKNVNIIKNMTNAIEKRGPDAEGYKIFDNAILGHRRLSIIDIDGGIQPLSTSCGNYTIVFNGEIYNYRELRKELVNLGAKFLTNSDTEVIVNGYKYFGDKIAKKLNGIFAFVIWDNIKKEVYLCRDYFGVKPLFYTIVNNTLVFGSELKAIFQHPKVDAKINNDSLKEIFGLFPSRTEGNGVFHNVKEIKQAHHGKFTINGFKEERYWNVKSERFDMTYEESKEYVRYLVTDSIKRQMMADVPISTFLSGGLDSSIITGIVANELGITGKNLDTYSFDFVDNSKFFKSNSFQVDEDKEWVKKVTKIFDTNHKYLFADNDNLVKNLYRVVDSKDLPGMADVDSSLLYFCDEVSKGHKVVLSGECADEIFGGYPWFHTGEKYQNFPWIRNVNVRENMLQEYLRSELNISNYIKSSYDNSISQIPRLDGESNEKNLERDINYINLKWFMTTLLVSSEWIILEIYS